MIGRFLIAVYVFSAVYCFIQIDTKIHQAMNIFLDRHPGFPIGKSGFFSMTALYLKIALVSSIPVVNTMLALFLDRASIAIVEDVVSEVELKFAADIMRQRQIDSVEEIKE